MRPEENRNRLHALILDDSENDTLLLVRHLRGAGYDLDWIRTDSAVGMREALTKSWDIILSDYSMPQFTALDALAIAAELKVDLPFIIVSGSIGEAAAVEAMKAGAHDFFLKDRLTRLASAVERERGEARLRAERRAMIQELRESQERLRQAVRARDEFLSIASHELRTPLTSLSLQVESSLRLLEEGQLPTKDKLKAKLGSVARQVSRLTAHLNNLLAVTRITSDRLDLTPETFDLREVVSGIVGGVEDTRRRSGSTITVHCEDPVVGEWDRHAIESVLMNLVSNALKYGNGKPIEVAVDTTHDRARLVVTDQGIGIPPEAQERVFHRFERAVPREHYDGFGLGLWVARQIVEGHGGTIAVASRPSAGSIFTVLLPLTGPPTPRTSPTPKASKPS